MIIASICFLISELISLMIIRIWRSTITNLSVIPRSLIVEQRGLMRTLSRFNLPLLKTLAIKKIFLMVHTHNFCFVQNAEQLAEDSDSDDMASLHTGNQVNLQGVLSVRGSVLYLAYYFQLVACQERVIIIIIIIPQQLGRSEIERTFKMKRDQYLCGSAICICPQKTPLCHYFYSRE